VSQNAADLCALAQEALCGTEPPTFCSVATTCSCESFDGSEFFYTTPAGTFCASTQEAADALAHAYACEHCGNPFTSTQIVGLDACTCFGVPYSSQIAYQGSRPIAWIITDGFLPFGLTLNSSTGLISGTPSSTGTYSFTVRAFVVGGNYATKTMSIAVIAISTTAIDQYTLGAAYSFQLQAAGGSGNYAWKINTGTLPTGLTMSITGLISGTPTAAGTSPLTFQVIDTVCDSTNRTFFIPRISTVAHSTTVLRTRRGYTEYIAGTGALYKKVTYSGYARQLAFVEADLGNPFNGAYCGGAQYIYSGSSQIDIYGAFVSSHRKDLFVTCLPSPEPALRDIFGLPTQMTNLLGYCWVPDPTTCGACSNNPNDWSLKRNDATHAEADFPQNIIAGNVGTSISATSFSVVVPSGGTGVPMYLGNFGGPGDVINYPTGTINGITSNYVQLRSAIDYTATLSEPFTVADEIASQLVYASNSQSSENKPNILTWVNDHITNIQSKTTSVNFIFTCSNLLDGEAYTVRYELWDSNGTATSVQSSFTASGTTHTILGTLPTPASGHSITLRNVRIAYT